MELLPIGTVCELKSRKQLVMITGLYASLFDDTLHIFDYQGCDYPRGTTLSNQNYRFNHDEIATILFSGYQSDQHRHLVEGIQDKLTLREGVAKEEQTNQMFTNFIFDENGFVVKASKGEDLENPFTVQNTTETTVNDQESSIFRNLKFDDQGYVISDGTETTTTEEKVQPTSEVPTNEVHSTGYTFDENGVVIAVDDQTNTPDINKKETEKETEVLSVNEPQATSKYKFDENGVVIAVGDQTKDSTIDEVEVLPIEETQTEQKYRFDENGIIVEVLD